MEVKIERGGNSLKRGSAIVSIASSRRHADWLWNQAGSLSANNRKALMPSARRRRRRTRTSALPNPSALMRLGSRRAVEPMRVVRHGGIDKPSGGAVEGDVCDGNPIGQIAGCLNHIRLPGGGRHRELRSAARVEDKWTKHRRHDRIIRLQNAPH